MRREAEETELDSSTHTVNTTLDLLGSHRTSVVQIAVETIPALQKLKEKGLVRAIGITGLPLDIYPYILDK